MVVVKDLKFLLRLVARLSTVLQAAYLGRYPAHIRGYL